MPWLGLNFNKTLVSADNPQHGGQPQSAAGKLGCKEGVEDACLCALVHARSGVANLDANISTGRQPLIGTDSSNIALVYLLLIGSNCYCTGLAGRNGLCSIDNQVHEHLLYLSDVR